MRRAATQLEGVRVELEAVDADQIDSATWLAVRARIGKLMADFDDSAARIDKALGLSSAHERILRYLRLRVGHRVPISELRGVAGIHEWARRVRELREDGWPIQSAITRPDVRVGEYLLEFDGRDRDTARTWAAAKRIRKLRSTGGTLPPKQRVLSFLTEIYPLAGDRQQLADVAGGERECRTAVEELLRDGHEVLSSEHDDSLPVGAFRLASVDG